MRVMCGKTGGTGQGKKHWEQGYTEEGDAVQVWRENEAGEEHKRAPQTAPNNIFSTRVTPERTVYHVLSTLRLSKTVFSSTAFLSILS